MDDLCSHEPGSGEEGRPHRGAQTWTGPLDLDVKDLQRAIRATGAALGVPITVQRERVDGPTLDKVATETHGRVVLEEFDDDGQQNIVIDIGSPLPIHGEIMLQGCSLEYYSNNVTEPVEGFYLFVAHFATALGFKPEPMHYTDANRLVEGGRFPVPPEAARGGLREGRGILAIEQPGRSVRSRSRRGANHPGSWSTCAARERRPRLNHDPQRHRGHGDRPRARAPGRRRLNPRPTPGVGRR